MGKEGKTPSPRALPPPHRLAPFHTAQVMDHFSSLMEVPALRVKGLRRAGASLLPPHVWAKVCVGGWEGQRAEARGCEPAATSHMGKGVCWRVPVCLWVIGVRVPRVDEMGLGFRVVVKAG